jgi:hypothetical protein
MSNMRTHCAAREPQSATCMHAQAASGCLRCVQPRWSPSAAPVEPQCSPGGAPVQQRWSIRATAESVIEWQRVAESGREWKGLEESGGELKRVQSGIEM